MATATQQHRRSIRAFLDQGTCLGEFLGSLRAPDFRRIVPGRSESVHDVVARLLVSQNALLTAFDQPTSQRPSSLPDFLAGRGISRHRVDQLAREIAAHETGPTLAGQFLQNHEDIASRIDGSPAIVAVDGAVLRSVDLLRATGLDWITCSDDLSRALPAHRPVARSRDSVADAVRVLADVLRARHPGQSVEVRIPPFAAVQCGTAGEPAHTRGTPPTVIECDPVHFLRLCRGRETWAEATRRGHVQASGVRADISDWLPLF